MKCPNDNEDLVMSERSGVEIDYCPKCRGVWLDRGELDKIIERASPQEAGYAQARQTQHHEREVRQKPYRKKKESFLSEIFDF
jgi:Zn-finger nucleic acid-binding protein